MHHRSSHAYAESEPGICISGVVDLVVADVPVGELSPKGKHSLIYMTLLLFFGGKSK